MNADDLMKLRGELYDTGRTCISINNVNVSIYAPQYMTKHESKRVKYVIYVDGRPVERYSLEEIVNLLEGKE